MSDLNQVTIYTDGACLGNPGPGGYAAVRISEATVIVSSRWPEFRPTGRPALTMNNRMEILAANILIEAIMKGWAQRWQANGWKRNRKEYAVNTDLWERLLTLCVKHAVEFVWVQGHAGYPENERCDRLCVAAAYVPPCGSAGSWRRRVFLSGVRKPGW